MQTLIFYSHLSIIFRLKNTPIFIKKHAISSLSSHFCSVILSPFSSQHFILQNKSSAFTSFLLSSLSQKQSKSQAKSTKSIFLFASSCHSRATFISKQTLTKADQHARLTNEYYLQKTTRKLFFLYICAIIVPQIEPNEAQK